MVSLISTLKYETAESRKQDIRTIKPLRKRIEIIAYVRL